MLGLETLVEIGQQVDPTTFNTTARQALNVYAVTGGQTSTRPDDPILNGSMANLSDPTEPGPGLPTHRLSISAPLCVNQLPFWLRAFFGPPVTTGTSPDYAHAFQSGASSLPYVSILHRLQSGDFRRHVGCVGQEFKLTLDPSADGFARVDMTFVGMEEQRATVAPAGTVAPTPALDRPAEARSNISWNGVSGGQIIGAELTFARNLKQIRSADGTGVPSRVEYDGKSSLTGSIKLRYQNQSIIADAWARTEREVVMELLKSAQRGLRLTAGQAVLDETPIGIDGPDGVELDVPLTAYQNASSAALLIAALSPAASFATL